MKITYFCTSGAGDPTRASIPFHLGVNGSMPNGDEVSFILGGDAAELITGDHFETVEGLGLPRMSELIGKVRDNRLPVYV